MKKTILLAAASVAAIGLASTATAQVRISGATVSGVTLTTQGGTQNAYALAIESDGSALANRQTSTTAGANTVASILPMTGTQAPGATDMQTRFQPGANGTTYSATLTLTGATFQTPVTNDRVTVTGAGAGCTPSTPNVVSGGGVGQNTVTVVFNVPGGAGAGACSTTNAPSGVTFDAPFTKDAGEAGVRATVSYAETITSAPIGGGAGSANLVSRINGYEVAVRSQRIVGADFVASLPTIFSLQSNYAALATGAGFDNVIGAVVASTATVPSSAAGGAVFSTMTQGALPAITADIAVSGNVAVLVPAVAGATLTPNGAGTMSMTQSAVALPRTNVTVTKTGAGRIVTPQPFSITVTPVLPLSQTVVVRPAPATAQVETVGQQGTNFLAAWVQSTNANFNTVLRIANGGSAIGGVTLTLQSPLGAVARNTCTSAELPKLASVPANGELALNSADFTTCFGNFTRGDIRVTVPALSDQLSAKIRIVNPGGVVTEQSLGGIVQGAAVVN